MTSSLQVNQAFVLEKYNNFIDFQLWPLSSRLDPIGWLRNFTPAEQEFALHLLNSFSFFSDLLVREMFLAAFQNVSNQFHPISLDFGAAKLLWRQFCDELVVTFVTGENPNPTDSGFLFARMARQFLSIPEERIIEPRDALRLLVSGSDRPILFVDDFVGSGQQFISTWNRLYDIGLTSGGRMSFRMHAALNGGRYFYTPVVARPF
ncbi:phosphoribosyltransferase-like protein [Bradyrhizobium sp. CCBAU 53380]|uniref:phosphoribosyltransferase-like protein n=1 Tax=Bradyrhizobium sp. CCBAU 53380 TaxID=1325117 RepID=UPI0023049DDC|nr:hypothetical protein [Bradyrhizobium sp. CCBAU 53380]MDA9425784.1 hypothetical protein [Bradyrhizobium sp. CCBAU 53380]